VSAEAAIDWTRYHDKTFRVTKIVDGDTLDIDVPDSGSATTRIRLWGVDTPELAHFGKPVMHFGPEAAEFAKNTLDGRSVHVVLSPKQTRGKFGRLLAYVFLERGGRMYNEMLLEQGYAYADLRFPHHYAEQFEAADRRARRDKIGLWANITPEKMPAWKQRFEKKKKKP
jgi:micrococcal nuclease